MGTPLRVLEAARELVDEINELAENARPRLYNHDQLLESVQSVAANIREAMGRNPGKDRNQFLRHARASAEETDEHLRPNVARKRISKSTFWRFHNRIAVIVRMLNKLMT